MAASAAVSTYAAHETPKILLFHTPLFCWAAWKREPAVFLVGMLLWVSAVYMAQDAREPEGTVAEQRFDGELIFESGATVDGDTLRGLAKTHDDQPVYATYKLQSEAEKQLFEAALGEAVFSVSGFYEEPAPPAHRYAFDMSTYLKRQGISHILRIHSMNSLDRRPGLTGWLAEQRNRLKTHIASTFPQSLQSEAHALLIGDRKGMSLDDERTFQTLGITHLYAISGLHVGILTGMAYFSLIRLRFRKETVQLLLILLLPLYALLTGGAPSVLRAVSMSCVFLFSRLLGIRIQAVSILFLTFIGFVLRDPYSIYQIGFQLSYGAAFAIIYSARLLKNGGVWKAGLLISSVTQLTLYPLLLVHFYELSLSAFIVNSLFVPLYSLFIVPANFLLLGLTYSVPALAEIVFSFYEPMRNGVGLFMTQLAEFPYQTWNPGKPEPIWIMVLFVSVLLFFSAIEKRFRWQQLLILLLPAVGLTLIPYTDSSLRISFLSVGQGDSTVIELPYRRGVYLIDTGGVLRFEQEAFKAQSRPYEIGRQVVVPYLKGRGIPVLDALILSHPDADHIEGAEEVAMAVSVRQLHITPGSLKEKTMKEILPFLNELSVIEAGEGYGWTEGSTKFRYLGPSDSVYDGNNDSLVLLVEHERFRILFPGDLEAAGEQEAVEKYAEELKEITVLKVAHHGSKTSSSEKFLSVTSPELSIVSSGAGNRYGHPNPEVMARFADSGLPVWNTAESGTVELVFDGNTFRAYSHR